VVAQVDPIVLGILRPPGECGVDVAVGEGQALGNRLDYGGPSFGLFAAREQFMRRMPGRIAGETVDADGRRGFVLTLQTREQHIRREKATSNICTSQALNALMGVVYLSWLGKRGVVEVGELMIRRTAYAREKLGLDLVNPGPVVREFAVRVPDLDTLGSCTMKHNPKLNERVASMPGFSKLHPLQDPQYAQGALELMWRLQGQLSEISGLPHVSLQPSAGSHGELAGLLLTRAY